MIRPAANAGSRSIFFLSAMMATRSQLLDRTQEQRRLWSVLREAMGGRGVTALIEGAPGIGKSSLLRAVRERAASLGMFVLSARGDEFEVGSPFGVARQVFVPVVSGPRGAGLLVGEARFAGPLFDVGEASAGSADGHRERHALIAVCRRLAGERSLALLVDDAQWSDVSSLRWLMQLGRSVDDASMAIVVAARRAQGEQGELLSRIGGHAGSMRITPSPLSEASVGLLIERQLGRVDSEFVSACRGVTGGNPFLLGELLRHLDDAELGCVGHCRRGSLARGRARSRCAREARSAWSRCQGIGRGGVSAR